MRPRTRRGENSLTSVDATGNSPPSPRPTMKRSTINAPTDVASADAPVAKPYSNSVAAKTWRRPILSANSPASDAPTAMPMNPTDAIHDVVDLSRSQCTASAAMMKDTSPMSMASSAQPMPEPNNRRLCFGVTGRRSRRWVRVSSLTRQIVP